MVDGKQYVSIAVGWGGAYGVSQRATEYRSAGHGVHFRARRQGDAAAVRRVSEPKACSPGVKYDPKEVPEGRALYVSHCVLCHGVPGVDRGGNIPNLGYVNAERSPI